MSTTTSLRPHARPHDTRTANRRPDGRAPSVESLEARRHFAIVNVSNFTLNVWGSTEPETIVVTFDDRGPNSTYSVTVDGADQGTFPFSQAREVYVHAYTGDDVVTCNGDPWIRRCTVDGGWGNDVITTSSGNDIITGDDGNDTINTGAGLDDIDGGDGNDTINAGGSGDTVVGGIGDDTIDAGDGADSITPGAGVDSVVGGPGIDSVSYGDHGNGVRVTLDGLANDGETGEGDNIGTTVENVSGTPRDDYIAAQSASAVNNELTGGDGDDTLIAYGGNDRLYGGYGVDALDGGEGIDYLEGGYDADTLTGGGGNDRIYGWYESAGWFAIPSLDGADLLDGGGGNDLLIAGYGDDRVLGGAGYDTLDGEEGNDLVSGGGDDDTLDGGPGADWLGGGAGTDILDYAARTENLNVSLDGLANDGTAGSGLTYIDPTTLRWVSDLGEQDNAGWDVEVVWGGSGNDRITARATDNLVNVFLGNGGNDTLDGGGGSDYLFGGAGDDTFYSRDSVQDTVYGDAGTDRVRGDAIDTLYDVEGTFEWLFTVP